ncbi:MAG: dihydropteroate synthase [Saprospiraceae bacterium]
MIEIRSTLNCKGRLLSLETPIVMGILNITPDSFYVNSRFQNEKEILEQAEKMLEEGAAILDIGGMSSRPGSTIISVAEELQRVLPTIEAILKHFPDTILSIDTVHAEVARQSVAAGVAIVNDIAAGRLDDKMYATVAELGVPYVLMHMQGTPQNMQEDPNYENVVREVLDFFIAEVGKLRALGVKDIIVDVGFGFGKTLQHNYQLLKHLHVFQILELPILTGISRKSMVYKPFGGSAKTALNGTTALHMVALQQGSKILRVHDVKEAVEVIKLWQQLI